MKLSLFAPAGGDLHGLWITRIWTGYDWITWLVVLNLACSGLLVSWIMKHADSIVKVIRTPPDLRVGQTASQEACQTHCWSILSFDKL